MLGVLECGTDNNQPGKTPCRYLTRWRAHCCANRLAVDHFSKEHHPCPHPACLERKFVVFSTEYELKAHFASEHGDEVKMSAAQRRQALTIPLQLQYRSRDDEDTELGPSARLERAAIIIGGGHNVSSRAARSGRAAVSGMHHSRSEPQIGQVASTSGQDGMSEVSSVTFTAEDFPAPSSSQQSAMGQIGRWAAFTGTQAGAGSLSEQDFPALPTLSKNQRRRIKDQQRTLAERLSAAAQPPRVLNRALPGPGVGDGPGGAVHSDATASFGQVLPGTADFPALRSLQSASLTPSAQSSQPVLPQAQMQSSSSSVMRAADVACPTPAVRHPPGLGQDAFPALGGGTTARQAQPSVSSTSSAYSDAAMGSTAQVAGPSLTQAAVLNNLFIRPGSATATMSMTTPASGSIPDVAMQLKAEDFPSLPGTSSKAAGKGRAVQGRPKASSVKAQTSGPNPVPDETSAPAKGGGGGVSNSLKAANKALIERIKHQLTGAAFDTFREQSMLFMRGALMAEEYHDYMVALGLLSLVSELVSLCPDPTKRRLLLDVHHSFICSPAAQDPSLVGAGWMPPEAAVAKANRVAQHSAWSCHHCSLCNAPDDGRCEACGSARPREEQLAAATVPVAVGLVAPAHAIRGPASLAAAVNRSESSPVAEPQMPLQMRPDADDFPPLFTKAARRGSTAACEGPDNHREVVKDEGGPADAAASPGANVGKGKKGKGTTIKIGLPTSGASGSSGGRLNPQNVWTQPAFKAKVANSWSGQGAGKLAKVHGAINDAWD
ncbi:hypothetical protein Vretifemale_1638 [Volvox reticuliferus]|uniref:RanBP2-type domain-containing protein n=1 Tax=Volvox reticuliferus TaxID=1737510 RepID=A0A8J4BYY4_9CHLO|nr:hypothetical protein Vretifemale_1638 [Volvox reticuliferus]